MVAGSSSEIVTGDSDKNGAPKKPFQGNNELPSSVTSVLSNSDLLVEILLRLPVISLVLFKSVSKHWLSLIKDTNFIKRRGQIPNIDPPSGIFVSHPVDYRYGFRRLDIRIPVRSSLFKITFKIGSKEEADSDVFVLQSCNGLLLCHVWPDKYYVYNPTIKTFKMIPQPSKSNVKPDYVCGMIMGFDPTKSPHYKVVYATSIGGGDDDDDKDVVSIQIQTYSSETHLWSSVCSDPFYEICFSGFAYGIYCNDAIHWLTEFFTGALHYKLGIVNKTVVLTKMQLPVTLDEKNLYESRGSLLLLGMDSTHFHQLNVYEMRDGHSEWSFKYFANLDDIMPHPRDWGIADGVPCIALGEREEDSFMVIRSDEILDAKAIQYNIGLKTYRDLSDPQLFFLRDSFLFTASFAGV